MTDYLLLDFILGAILGYTTVWYIHSVIKELSKMLKKKHYTLYIYHEGNQKFEKVTTYKERSMRNAITEHFLSYNGNATISHFKTITDYNDNTMRYLLTVDGDAYLFTMLREAEGVTNEQG